MSMVRLDFHFVMSRVLKIPDPTTGGFLQNLIISTGFGKVPHFETCVQIFDLRLISLGEISFLVPQVTFSEQTEMKGRPMVSWCEDVGGLPWDMPYIFALRIFFLGYLLRHTLPETS